MVQLPSPLRRRDPVSVMFCLRRWLVSGGHSHIQRLLSSVSNDPQFYMASALPCVCTRRGGVACWQKSRPETTTPRLPRRGCHPQPVRPHFRLLWRPRDCPVVSGTLRHHAIARVCDEAASRLCLDRVADVCIEAGSTSAFDWGLQDVVLHQPFGSRPMKRRNDTDL